MTKKEYIEYLLSNNLSKDTAKTYYLRLAYYVKYPDKLKDRDRKYINQTKQAVKYYYKAQDIYYNDITVKLNELHKITKKPKRKIEPTLYLKKVNMKINLMNNKELRKKVAFRLQEISGLRIAEIADLEKENIKFLDNYRIQVTVKHGKGNKTRTIKAIRDKYVYEKLKELEPRANNKLFHSKVTLMKKANELGFKTHRLRKVFADQINLKIESKADDKRVLLQKALGHETGPRNKTYKRYIDTNINYTGTKFDIGR
jgi:integrase